MQLASLDAMNRTIYKVSSVNKKGNNEFASLLFQALQAQYKPEAPKEKSSSQASTNIYEKTKLLRTAEKAERKTEVISQYNKYDSLITTIASKYGIEPAVLKALIKTESNFNETARSREGALGLTQIMPHTAQYLGINPLIPAEAIEGGAIYLRQMLNRYNGNLEMALAAYNAGPGSVDRYGCVPPYRETYYFIQKVREHMALYKNDFMNKSL